jgi:hypothetical protein
MTKKEIIEALMQLNEVDRDMCEMTHEQWIKEVASALTDPVGYFVNLDMNYKLYRSERI